MLLGAVCCTLAVPHCTIAVHVCLVRQSPSLIAGSKGTLAAVASLCQFAVFRGCSWKLACDMAEVKGLLLNRITGWSGMPHGLRVILSVQAWLYVCSVSACERGRVGGSRVGSTDIMSAQSLNVAAECCPLPPCELHAAGMPYHLH